MGPGWDAGMRSTPPGLVPSLDRAPHDFQEPPPVRGSYPPSEPCRLQGRTRGLRRPGKTLPSGLGYSRGKPGRPTQLGSGILSIRTTRGRPIGRRPLCRAAQQPIAGWRRGFGLRRMIPSAAARRASEQSCPGPLRRARAGGAGHAGAAAGSRRPGL